MKRNIIDNSTMSESAELPELRSHQSHAARLLPHPKLCAVRYKTMEDPSAARSELSLELLDAIGVWPCVQLLFLRLRPF